jgi:NADH:ubiquinone oxidoreductase subunit 6 (subunit J)
LINPMNFPIIVFLVSVFVLWLSIRAGMAIRKRRELEDAAREDFNLVLSATLTLLALIIGFSFSMAISRYDQRKNYEEAEANAIGTEYVRADLLPNADAAAKIKSLLSTYTDERILFYTTREPSELERVDARVAQLQNELWALVVPAAGAQPNPVVALAVAGMNDVLNSQGYTQAAWWNRIPTAAWCLLAAIAICCSVLVGYGSHHVRGSGALILVLPVIVSIAFLLIADIDSPRGGLIRVKPQNLHALAASMRSAPQAGQH